MKTIIIALVALVAGTGIGYFLRLIISLGKKGSIELEVKQLLVQAKEEAQKILAEAKNKELAVHEEVKKIEKEKEVEWKRTEERLIKKEGFLDERQHDIDKEVENLKKKIAINESKIKVIKSNPSTSPKMLEELSSKEKDYNDLRRKLDEYSLEMKENLGKFKVKMNHEVNEISIDLNDLTVNNKK